MVSLVGYLRPQKNRPFVCGRLGKRRVWSGLVVIGKGVDGGLKGWIIRMSNSSRLKLSPSVAVDVASLWVMFLTASFGQSSLLQQSLDFRVPEHLDLDIRQCPLCAVLIVA